MKIKNCPKCESVNIRRRVHVSDTAYDICADCATIWESIPTGEHFKRDGELMPFKEPCDNCAFRPGSPESKDREGWKALMQSLKDGGKFFCHKGVPVIQGEDNSFKAFDYPKRQLKTESVGPIEVHDQDRMRMCRGYLNAWIVWTRRKYAESKEQTT